jgi:hypothetical protein
MREHLQSTARLLDFMRQPQGSLLDLGHNGRKSDPCQNPAMIIAISCQKFNITSPGSFIRCNKMASGRTPLSLAGITHNPDNAP